MASNGNGCCLRTEQPCNTDILGNEEDVLDIAAQYTVEDNGQEDTTEIREELRLMLREERKKRKTT